MWWDGHMPIAYKIITYGTTNEPVIPADMSFISPKKGP